MKKLIYSNLILLVFAVGCDRYLDVKPVDKFLDDQVYSNAQSIRNALNGIYLNLAKPALYGANFTATTMDVLAQYYNCSASTHPFYKVYSYDYASSEAQSTFSTIWGEAYKAILNLNLFISKVGPLTGVLDEEERKLLLGEAYGLRSWVAFDLLRLFGPVYATDSTALSIPYPLTAEGTVSPLLPANELLSKVVHDLDTASILLQNDPVLTEGVKPLGNDVSNVEFFVRNRRFNKLAAQAVKARVLLYRGDKGGALIAATAVIEQAAKWFPWSPSALSNAGLANPDRIFSSEVIFGLENINLYNLQTDWFAASLTSHILIPHPNVLSAVYENYENDYRLRSSWAVDRTSTRTDKTFFKYADITDKTLSLRYLQPMVRMSELYFIAAECETNSQKAIEYLNSVGFNRGLPDLSPEVNVTQELNKAYRKEFWGEGQLFFYYKRTQVPSISKGLGSGIIEMTADAYVVPLPLTETQYR